MTKINCFVPFQVAGVWEETLEELTANDLVNRIYLMGPEVPGEMPDGCAYLKTDGRFSTDTIRKIADYSTGVSHTMLFTGATKISFGMLSLERFVQVAGDTGEGLWILSVMKYKCCVCVSAYKPDRDMHLEKIYGNMRAGLLHINSNNT